MRLAAGTRLGPYEILAPLGAGGMGEVYRARDTRLDRSVAVKVLPSRQSSSPEARLRFEREAKAISRLSHPHICTLHDVGQQDGVDYLVMELLEGETLDARLTRGALPLEEALRHGIAIADALDWAHRSGIVHRDLKPRNVMLTKSGAKLLDFGLAKPLRRVFPGSSSSNVQTASAGADVTTEGTLLGTLHYMAPEQLEGRAADARTDVFALGNVLYQMLAGKRPFDGTSPAMVASAILQSEPVPISVLRPDCPSALDRLIRTCLAKDPNDRWQAAHDVKLQLEALIGEERTRATPPALPRHAPWIVAGLATAVADRSRMAAGAVLLLALGGGLGWLASQWLRQPPPPWPARIRSLTFSGFDREPSASPDGRLVAFTSRRDGRSRVWIKQIGGGEAPLTSGEDRYPRFSPDGSSLLFLRAEGERRSVYRQPLVGGEARRVVADAVEADWSPEGRRIAFVRSRVEGPRRLTLLLTADSQTGGETAVGQVENRDLVGLRWSPDGRMLAATESPTTGQPGVYMLDLWDVRGGGEPRRIALSGGVGLQSSPAWSGDGRELVVATSKSLVGDNSGTIGLVSRLDLPSGRLWPLFWAPGLFQFQGIGNDWTRIDILRPEGLVFSASSVRQALVEFTIAGQAAGGSRVLTQGSSVDRQPVYSPDGRRVVFTSNRSGNLDLWSLTLADGALQQLTDDPTEDWDPAFSPDGQHLLWGSSRDGRLQIWTAEADGSGARRVTADPVGAENPTATPGTEWIAYTSDDPSTPGVHRVRLDGTSGRRIVQGPYTNAEVSPDGRFVAFVDTRNFSQLSYVRVAEMQTGAIVPFEIEIRHANTASAPVFLGRHRWTPDGKAIAFVGLDQQRRTGVWVQEFAPGRDTSSARRRLAGFSAEYATESFGLSPDGTHIVVSTFQLSENLMIAEEVQGVVPPRRGAP